MSVLLSPNRRSITMSDSSLLSRKLNKHDKNFLRVFKMVEETELQMQERMKSRDAQSRVKVDISDRDRLLVEYLDSMNNFSASACEETNMSNEKFHAMTADLKSLFTRTLRAAGEYGNRDRSDIQESIDRMNKDIDDIVTGPISDEDYQMWLNEKDRIRAFFKKHPVAKKDSNH